MSLVVLLAIGLLTQVHKGALVVESLSVVIGTLICGSRALLAQHQNVFLAL